MKVQVKLFGEFCRYVPKGISSPTFRFEVQEGSSLEALLDSLGIPPEVPKTLVHNHRAGKTDTLLREDDIVAVFPPVAGGG